jgi:hypothetical protein
MENVQSLKILDNYCLELTFSTNEIKVFDCKPYLEKGVFKSLKIASKFNQAYVDYGTVCWPNGLDISPDTLYDKSYSYA